MPTKNATTQITKSAAKPVKQATTKVVKNVGPITGLFYAISKVGDIAADYKRGTAATSTVAVLLFYCMVKLLNQKSMKDTAVGKQLNSMTLIYSSILATYQYANGYATIKALPKKKGSTPPQYYNIITGEMVNHTDKGTPWLSKGVPSEHATLYRELNRILKLTDSNATVLLDAFSDCPESISVLLDQITNNPTKAGLLIQQNSKINGVLHNYRAMAILKEKTTDPEKGATTPPSAAVTVYTPAIIAIADSLMQIKESDSKLYQKVLHSIKKVMPAVK